MKKAVLYKHQFKRTEKIESINFLAFNLLLVQLSLPYMTTGKTIALTIWTPASKVMPLLFNTLPVCHSFSSKEQASLIPFYYYHLKFLTVL